MTQKSRRSRQARPKKPAQPAFGPRAMEVFCGLDPQAQYLLLNTLAALASRRGTKQVRASSLCTTAGQRQVAREMAAAYKTTQGSREKYHRERVQIQMRLQTLHNRAQLRNSRRRYLTEAEQRRPSRMYSHDTRRVEISLPGNEEPCAFKTGD